MHIVALGRAASKVLFECKLCKGDIDISVLHHRHPEGLSRVNGVRLRKAET